MNRRLEQGVRNSTGWIALALLSATVAFGQQTGTSLADVARQARAQKQAQSQPAAVIDTNSAQVPAGFQTYSAGDYQILVPAPYHLDGHDANGVVLSGPVAGSKRAVVLVGNPITARFDSDGVSFGDTATQIAHQYAPAAQCSEATVANHNAYSCQLDAATVLDRKVSGSAVFVRTAAKLYPVFCFVYSEPQASDSTASTAKSQPAPKPAEDSSNTVLQKCATVFQSIRLADGAAPSVVASSQPGVDTASKAAPSTSVAAAEPPAPRFKAQPFTYCRSARECWNASVIIPSEAQLLSSDCKQFVFEIKLKGDPFLLLAGPGNGCDGQAATNASVVRWKQLVAPESERAPGTSSTITAQQMTLDGKSAVITQMSFKKGLADWIAKRAEVDANGTQVVVGCMAPKDRFSDGDAVCTSLIESLRMP